MLTRKLTAAALALGTLTAFFHVPAARLLPPPFCRVWLDPHDKFTRVVPAPRARASNSLTADAQISNIDISFGSGVPGPAQVAFRAAVDTWQTQVASPIRIVIS